MYEQLIAAMKVIRDECESHEDCAYCPLRGEDKETCDIMSMVPIDWEFDETPPKRILL